MVDDEYPIPKPENTLRIALLGDPFAASEYLPSAEKFEGILEHRLTDLMGKKVEILNFGASGSETWSEPQIFHLKAAKYKPDVTLLAFYWDNDIGDNIRHVHANDPNPILEQYDAPLVGRLKETRTRFNKALWNNSLLYQMVHDGYGHVEQTVKHWFRPHYLQQIDQLAMSDFRGITPTSFSPKAIPAKDTDNDDDDLFFRDSAGWKITRTLILKLKAEVEAAGGRLVLIHFRSEGLVLSGLPVPHEAFDSFLKDNDIPSVSLFQNYSSMDLAQLRTHFIPKDGHWTRRGHCYVARTIEMMLYDTLSMQ